MHAQGEHANSAQTGQRQDSNPERSCFETTVLPMPSVCQTINLLLLYLFSIAWLLCFNDVKKLNSVTVII